MGRADGGAVKLGSLFSGAGGLDLAVEAVFGATTVWQCEQDKAAAKVLAYHWPNVPNLGDITAVDWNAVEPVDILCGGFPCQDVSAAGKRAGIKDGTRSGLWAVFADAIDALRPSIVIIENVRGLLSAIADRTEVDEQQPCVCGWLDRWRGMRASVRVEEHLSGACDRGHDGTGSCCPAMASQGVGRLANSWAGSDRQVEFGVGVDSDRRGSWDIPAEGSAIPSAEVGPGEAGSRSGADSRWTATPAEWQWGMELASACRVRSDQAEVAPAQREGRACGDCGGFVIRDTSDSDMEPGTATVGNGAGGPVLRAAGAVLGDLADLGYDAVWATVAAASVGAPHRRERVFIVATDAAISSGNGLQQQDLSALEQRRGNRRPRQSGVCDCGDSPCGADAADSSRYGWDEGRPESARLVGGSDAAVSGDELGVALLPTPTTQDGANNGGPSQFQRNTLPLNAEVTLLPTPRSTSDTNGAGHHGDGGMDLRTTVTLLLTPNAQDGNGGGRYSSEGHQTTLPGEVRLLPTPKAHDGEFGTPRTTGRPIEKSTHQGTITSLEKTSHWGKYAPAIARWEQIVGPAPAPTEPNKNGNPRLSAAFSEWLMGWPAGWVTNPDIGISRNDQLRITGNGVVSLQCEYALRYLLSVAEVSR